MSDKPDPMLFFAKSAVVVLSNQPPTTWAALFVQLRIDFFRLFQRGLVTSTVHGLDFFQNVIDVIEGRLVWDEEGEYGENFRKIIKGRPRA